MKRQNALNAARKNRSGSFRRFAVPLPAAQAAAPAKATCGSPLEDPNAEAVGFTKEDKLTKKQITNNNQ
jgi:hypothetical protein